MAVKQVIPYETTTTISDYFTERVGLGLDLFKWFYILDDFHFLLPAKLLVFTSSIFLMLQNDERILNMLTANQ